MIESLGPPLGPNESTLLVGLFTPICCPGCWLAPGLLVRAPRNFRSLDTGKGLLTREREIRPTLNNDI